MLSMNAKSVCGFSLVVPQGKWTWTDSAGPPSGITIVSVFTVLAVISGCVVLAALFRSNQCIIVRKKFVHSVQDVYTFLLLYMHICISLSSQSRVLLCLSYSLSYFKECWIVMHQSRLCITLKLKL